MTRRLFELEDMVSAEWRGPFSITMANSGHYRVTIFKGDTERSIQATATPSDKRGTLNFRTRLRRIITEINNAA